MFTFRCSLVHDSQVQVVGIGARSKEDSEHSQAQVSQVSAGVLRMMEEDGDNLDEDPEGVPEEGEEADLGDPAVPSGTYVRCPSCPRGIPICSNLL